MPERIANNGSALRFVGEPEDKAIPVCGVIMPISATSSHGEVHWSDVQTLLHRAITEAGFTPLNVWENTAADRVSERIIANIFEQPLVVADISDLNPNVMFELGLRLASKKPTIVIVNSGGTIPFDIRDFHAIPYPADLNMLGMEKFFRLLASALKEKHEAWLKNEYQPFLGTIVVDVITPGHREITADVAIVDKLDDITRRLARIEVREAVASQSTRSVDNTLFQGRGSESYYTVRVNPAEALAQFMRNPLVAQAATLGADANATYLSLLPRSERTDGPELMREELRANGLPEGCSEGITGAVLRKCGIPL